MPILILLNPETYQALESVIMNHRVHYFHDLGLSYFYRIKAMSWITADYLQWAIYVKIKSPVYMCIKETNTKLCILHLYFTHYLLKVNFTQIRQ